VPILCIPFFCNWNSIYLFIHLSVYLFICIFKPHNKILNTCSRCDKIVLNFVSGPVPLYDCHMYSDMVTHLEKW
jgi:hypothetical protein